MIIIKSLEEFGLLIKGVRETIKNEAKKQKGGFSSMFKTQKYYQNEPKFKGVYSRNDSPKIKRGAYVINLGEYESIGTHWIALCVNDNNLTYFNSFGAEHI